MNILFLSISSLPHISEHGISLDLIHEFKNNGHNVYIISSLERRDKQSTFISKEAGCTILRVKIGNNKRTNIIEKGLTTFFLPRVYIKAIKQYYSNVKFDLVIYPTPPVTQAKTVKFIKNRDGARSYLLLKDIFPQNAVDLGMMKTTGIRGLIYKYFRRQEKNLYAVSDRIGCMSQANVDYIINHNSEVDVVKLEVCPNSIEIIDKSIDKESCKNIKTKYKIPMGKKVFVYGGNLGKPQGIPFVIECIEKCKSIDDAFFLIVGNGTDYKRIEQYIEKTNPTNCKLMKWLPKEDYNVLVAACDVGLVFLDHRFTIPNFPSRILSYMQARIPILACTDNNTDVGRTIVEGGFGWWCESDDVMNFEETIRAIVSISDVELDVKKGNAFRCLEQNYNVAKACQIIMNNRGQ